VGLEAGNGFDDVCAAEGDMLGARAVVEGDVFFNLGLLLHLEGLLIGILMHSSGEAMTMDLSAEKSLVWGWNMRERCAEGALRADVLIVDRPETVEAEGIFVVELRC
jgi:hypothetical protein